MSDRGMIRGGKPADKEPTILALRNPCVALLDVSVRGQFSAGGWPQGGERLEEAQAVAQQNLKSLAPLPAPLTSLSRSGTIVQSAVGKEEPT